MSVKQKFWQGLFLAGGAGVAALAAVNASIARGVAPEPEDSSLGGEAREFAFEYGRVFYRVAGLRDGREPILFLHDIGAGASSFMWRKNFDSLAADFQLYAPDLPGFGLSDKSASAPYSADLYTAFIRDFLREEVRRTPAHLVAGGLSAAFAVRVADEHPALVSSLTLISPHSVNALQARPDLPGAAFYGLLHSPVLGASFYNAMTSERSLRDYARKRLFYDPRFATPRLVAHYYNASHQPDAQHAVAAFLSGYLNTDTREAFARLTQPVTLVWGKQDLTTPVAQAAALLSLNSRARLEVFDRCRMMPQTEHAEKFNALIRATIHSRSAAA
jgi:pimeloyl-ACP methyl ester carboxylesterase